MNQEDLIKLSIAELQKMYSDVKDLHLRTRTAVGRYIGGGLAFFVYFYNYQGTEPNRSLQKVLYLPEENYGIILYLIGVGLCLVGMALLVVANRPTTWSIPTDLAVHEKLGFKSIEKYLNYSKTDYIQAITKNLKSHKKVTYYLKHGSFLLIVGAILLLIIKSFR